MARLEIDGIDGLMAGLNKAGSAMQPRIERALTLSADVLTQALVKEEMSSFKDPSGLLGDTLGSDGAKHAVSASFIEVYAQGMYSGRRGSARRAGLVAAMVEYKHKNPWNKRAVSKSRKRINSIIAEALGPGGDGFAGGGARS